MMNQPKCPICGLPVEAAGHVQIEHVVTPFEIVRRFKCNTDPTDYARFREALASSAEDEGT